MQESLIKHCSGSTSSAELSIYLAVHHPLKTMNEYTHIRVQNKVFLLFAMNLLTVSIICQIIVKKVNNSKKDHKSKVILQTSQIQFLNTIFDVCVKLTTNHNKGVTNTSTVCYCCNYSFDEKLNNKMEKFQKFISYFKIDYIIIV